MALVVAPTVAGSVTLEPFEFDCKLGDMDAEMACIKRKLGWTEVTSCNQTSYSKNCFYPDIFYFHDGSKKKALPNPIARLQQRDPKSVRGSVVVVRAEPLRVRDYFGTGTHTTFNSPSQNTSLWTPRLGHKEVLDTLAFFTTTTFPEVDKVRAFKRMRERGLTPPPGTPHLFLLAKMALEGSLEGRGSGARRNHGSSQAGGKGAGRGGGGGHFSIWEVLPREVITSFCAKYEGMSREDRGELLCSMAEAYIPSPHDVTVSYHKYESARQSGPHEDPHKDALAYEVLREELAPLYESLFQNIVADLEGGVPFVVRMRADLLAAIAQREKRVKGAKLSPPTQHHLKTQLQSWFTPGLLELRRITYETSSGALLEKIARLEAVHEIRSLQHLKDRLGHGRHKCVWHVRCYMMHATRRRCFAFMHPCMPEEPLVFVHVALLPQLAHSMDDIARGTGHGCNEGAATCAIFYSITRYGVGADSGGCLASYVKRFHTQRGLKGVQLGNFLIKRVAKRLKQELPQLTIFSTLSPIPGLLGWLRVKAQQEAALRESEPARAAAKQPLMLPVEEQPHWNRDAEITQALEPILMRLAAAYICMERSRGRIICPVGNFHVSNGAGIERLNFMADPSEKGMRQSAGIMVNYKYTLDMVEANSDAYNTRGHASIAPQVLALLG
ncbi:malonyl-CoA decarboxylase-domain-containing protein [Tribonema minus]|uniref:Malonyl-CoA decarboxylase-domain-containing protein n=1 Tax=Tribonema minus TaxID=303371 RepID=A0A836CH19_9STRA|nr:malonyl-CoA decarboxylase-domain-containing protein [Tribonema minus]